jgi:biotin synthase
LEHVLDALETARRIVLEEAEVLDRDVLAGLAALRREQVGELLTLADDVRRRASGDAAAVEVLFNAKKGGCSEDCHFCSQSARYATDVVAEPLRETHEFLAAAREARDRGAAEFCIVVAVRGPSPALLDRVCDATRAIVADMPEMHVAVSLGILNDHHCTALLEAGVHKVNHNLETSRRHFPAICTTHSYDERWETCLRAKRHGFELCSGGIIGMGETAEDRLDFLCALQALRPVEVPINFLNPRPGTPFADRSIVDPVEALRFVAMARLALPYALVRLAGGREITLQGLQDLGMRSGASGIVLGAYLTTAGREDDEDFAMLERTGFRILSAPGVLEGG